MTRVLRMLFDSLTSFLILLAANNKQQNQCREEIMSRRLLCREETRAAVNKVNIKTVLILTAEREERRQWSVHC